MNLPCVLTLVGGSHYRRKAGCFKFLGGLRSTFTLFREKIMFIIENSKKSHQKKKVFIVHLLPAGTA